MAQTVVLYSDLEFIVSAVLETGDAEPKHVGAEISLTNGKNVKTLTF